MSEWKDLDISNIPSDFFVNERYEIECLESGNVWKVQKEHLDNRPNMIKNIFHNWEYRYRLKPLKPILIPMEMIKDYSIDVNNFKDNQIMKDMARRYGRPVEIIA